MEDSLEDRPPAPVAAVEESPERPEVEPAAKQIYLRTVYPLNPGIPHFVDVPGGW
jgi:hypothetical protein